MTTRRTAGPLEKAVAAALRTATTMPQDGATKALATRYARLVDEADQHAAEAAQTWLELDPTDQIGRQRLAKLDAAVQAHTVAADLGPKLLAALDKLLMTPAARVSGTSTKGGARNVPSKLNALRDEVAAARRKRAGQDGA